MLRQVCDKVEKETDADAEAQALQDPGQTGCGQDPRKHGYRLHNATTTKPLKSKRLFWKSRSACSAKTTPSWDNGVREPRLLPHQLERATQVDLTDQESLMPYAGVAWVACVGRRHEGVGRRG